MDGKPRRDGTVAILNLAPALAHLGIELVAQDGEKPCAQIRARLKAGLLVPGLYQRFLYEIIGAIGVFRQRNGKGPQARYGLQQAGPEIRSICHTDHSFSVADFEASFCSSWLNNCVKRSGISSDTSSS